MAYTKEKGLSIEKIKQFSNDYLLYLEELLFDVCFRVEKKDLNKESLEAYDLVQSELYQRGL